MAQDHNPENRARYNPTISVARISRSRMHAVAGVVVDDTAWQLRPETLEVPTGNVAAVVAWMNEDPEIRAPLLVDHDRKGVRTAAAEYLA